MSTGLKSQPPGPEMAAPAPVSLELIIPNPRLKLMDQVKEVIRLGMVESSKLMVESKDHEAARTMADGGGG